LKTYILKKLVLLVPMLFGITFITFTFTKALPGDPVYTLVGERTRPEIIEKLRARIGEDKGVIQQYFGYLSLLLKGEMGRSYYTNRDVLDDLLQKFPNTLRLAACAMLIATPFGVLLGFICAIKKNSASDRIISGLSLTGLSIPVFWSGLILMLFFSLKLQLLPPSGTGNMRYLILPSITLALPALATLVRVTRVTVLDVLNTPFIRTAKAKGIRNIHINIVHILKNALIPVITVFGLEFGSYLNGAVLTETIFGWDGIGRFAMEGIIKRDYPVIMGCILAGTIIFVVINVLMDIFYHYIDPRVRLHGADR
jgi:ABC-type dipeptide/oligopeptide/nickel transport system permease component